MKEIKRKSLLNRSKVEYGDYAVNHLQGCSHGCTFPCYAFLLSRRTGRTKSYGEWCQPKIVVNALELLEKEIPKKRDKIQCVQLSFMTDPFMYEQPEASALSLKIIERLNQEGIKCSTLTKGVYPADLADTTRYIKDNLYGMSLVSLDERFRRKYEPHTATFEDRIKSLKTLHECGLKTWISIEPYPTRNIIDQNLNILLETVDFVDKIVFGRWHYNHIVSQSKDCKAFYNECADKITQFCKQRDIECYIKNKTRT